MRFLWLVHLIAIVLKTLLWTALFALALLESAQLHLSLPVARRIARELTGEFVNDEIRGELHIGRLDQLSPEHIVARHVTLRDGEGRRIISADRVELVPDFAQLRRGLLLFKVGRISHAVVRLVDNGEGEPSLFTAFDSRKPSTGGESLRVRVDDVWLEDLTLYGQVIELEGVRVERVEAHGNMAIGGDVDIQILSARGTMLRPYDFVGEITALSGTISSNALRGTKLRVAGTRGEESIEAQVAYRSAAADLPSELALELDTPRLTPDTLRRVRYAFAEPLKPDLPLQGHVELTGPPEELSLSAQVQSAAGNAVVTGKISSVRGVSVHVTSDAIEIEQLVEDGPDVRARGLLHVSVGPEPDAKPEVHAEIGSLRYSGVQVPAFVLDGELEEKGIRIDRARATHGGQISLRGRVGFDGHTDLHVDAQFNTVQRDPNLARLLPDLEGALATSLHVRTPAKDRPTRLDIEGKLELRDARFGSLQAARVLLTGKAHGDPDLPQVDVEVQSEAVQILFYKLGNARFTMNGGPNHYTARGEFEAKGQKTFSFDASVDADKHGFVVQAEPIEFTVGSESWRGALRNLSVQHAQGVELGFLRLGSRAQRLEAKGIMRMNGEDSLQAQLQNFDVTALRAVLGESFPLTFGYADANLELRGDVAEPELSLSGALREASVANLEHVDALYTLSYKDGHLELDSDLDLKERGSLQLSGQGELDGSIPDPAEALRGGLYNLNLEGKQIDVTLIPQLKGVVHAGRLQGALSAQGGLESVTVSGHLDGSDVYALDWAELELGTRFKYDHDELSLQLRASDALGTLGRARSTWHVDWRSLNQDPRAYAERLLSEDFQADGQTTERALDELPFPLAFQNPWPVRFGSRFDVQRKDGRLTGQVQAALTPKLRLYDASCNVSSDSKLETRWTLHDERAELALEALLDGKRVAAGSGTVLWPFARLLRAERVSEAPQLDGQGNVQLPQLERVPGLCRHGRGQLQADWSVRGAGRDLPEAEVALRAQFVPQLLGGDDVAATPVERCQRDPLKFNADARANASGFSLQAAAHGCSGGPAKLDVQLPWQWSSVHPMPVIDDKRDSVVRLDLREAELEPVLDYLPGVRGFSGLASGQLTARSHHGRVTAQGRLALSGGRLYAIPTGQELTDVELSLTANGNWLKLDTLFARAGRGSFEASGGIGFEDGWAPKRVQLGLVLRELPIQREGLDLAWLSGSAAVLSELSPGKARTAVKLHSLAVRLPSAETRSPQTLEPHSDITLTTDPPRQGTDKPFEFEFAIDGRNQLTARRNDFEAALAAELAVSYRDPQLNVGGFIEFRRGSFELFGKNFELNRGSMQFDGSTELNPEVSMVATHQPLVVGGSPVVVNVSGTLAKPEVEFYSDRCPGEGAIVLLVSGQCPSETTTDASDSAATRNAFATGLIGGILTLGAQRQLSGLIPRLAVERSARGTRTRLRAGWEAVPPFMRSLVQRVYLQGAISTADSGASSTGANTGQATPDFLLELYFPNNIVGAGRVAPTTRSWGLDVTWEP